MVTSVSQEASLLISLLSYSLVVSLISCSTGSVATLAAPEKCCNPFVQESFQKSFQDRAATTLAQETQICSHSAATLAPEKCCYFAATLALEMCCYSAATLALEMRSDSAATLPREVQQDASLERWPLQRGVLRQEQQDGRPGRRQLCPDVLR